MKFLWRHLLCPLNHGGYPKLVLVWVNRRKFDTLILCPLNHGGYRWTALRRGIWGPSPPSTSPKRGSTRKVAVGSIPSLTVPMLEDWLAPLGDSSHRSLVACKIYKPGFEQMGAFCRVNLLGLIHWNEAPINNTYEDLGEKNLAKKYFSEFIFLLTPCSPWVRFQFRNYLSPQFRLSGCVNRKISQLMWVISPWLYP